MSDELTITFTLEEAIKISGSHPFSEKAMAARMKIKRAIREHMGEELKTGLDAPWDVRQMDGHYFVVSSTGTPIAQILPEGTKREQRQRAHAMATQPDWKAAAELWESTCESSHVDFDEDSPTREQPRVLIDAARKKERNA